MAQSIVQLILGLMASWECVLHMIRPELQPLWPHQLRRAQLNAAQWLASARVPTHPAPRELTPEFLNGATRIPVPTVSTTDNRALSHVYPSLNRELSRRAAQLMAENETVELGL